MSIKLSRACATSQLRACSRDLPASALPTSHLNPSKTCPKQSSKSLEGGGGAGLAARRGLLWGILGCSSLLAPLQMLHAMAKLHPGCRQRKNQHHQGGGILSQLGQGSKPPTSICFCLQGGVLLPPGGPVAVWLCSGKAPREAGMGLVCLSLENKRKNVQCWPGGDSPGTLFPKPGQVQAPRGKQTTIKREFWSKQKKVK